MKKLLKQVSVYSIVIAIAIISLCAAQDDVLCKTDDYLSRIGIDDISTTGICINLKTQIKDCPPLHKLLRDKNFTALRESFCEGIDDLEKIKVCCPLSQYKERRPAEKEETDFSEHPNFRLLPDLSSCGVGATTSDDRIIGGKDAQPGDFPWMARLGILQDGEHEVDFPCGGTIINKRYIMTSAHCFKGGNRLEVIRLGETDDNTDEDCVKRGDVSIACSKTEDYDYEKIIVHPGYTGLTGSADDIALIRLNKDIANLTSYFTRPICLPLVEEYGVATLDDYSLQTRKGTIAGWGKTSNYGNPEGSHILQYLFVPIKPNVACRVAYPTNNIVNTQICAGGRKKDVCLGDSGSPLTYPGFSTKDRTLRNYQIGIVSFGRAKCATEDIPVVYTRVRSYLKWILDNLRE